MSGRRFEDANAEATAALRELLASLDETDLSADLGGGWTVSMALAHLAFWDAWHLTRWQDATATGQSAPAPVADAVSDWANASLEATWRALPAAAAVALALAAADAVDAHVAGLPDAAVEAARAVGGARWVERSAHRADHIEQIRRAIGRA